MNIGGKKINKWWLVGGAAGVVAAYYFYKKSSSASSSGSATSTATSIDPLTGLPYSQDNQIDPMTGMTYLTEAQEYGSVSAAEAAVSSGAGYLGSSSYSGLDSGYPTGYYPGTTTTPTPTATTYTTNAQWSQAVQAGLAGIGYSATDIAAALGLFFQQHPLSPAQASIIQAAVAEFGPPPVGGPWNIIPSPEPPPPSGGGEIKGLKVSAAFDNVTGSWEAVSGATGYTVTVTTRQGAKQLAGGTTSKTSYSAGNLPQKTDMAFHVSAQPGGQTATAYTSTK